MWFVIAGEASQQEINQNGRNPLINKIVSVLLKMTHVDIQSLSPDSISAMKKLAKNIENRAFNAAKDRADYFRRVTHEITTIREAYTQKQSLTKEQLLTATLPPSDDQDRLIIHANNSNSSADPADVDMDEIPENPSTKIEVRTLAFSPSSESSH